MAAPSVGSAESSKRPGPPPASPSAGPRKITETELAKHNRADDIWIAINGQVYDLTKFLKAHPGGKAVLLQVAGTDATKQFYALHNKDILEKYKKLRIGKLYAEDGATEKRAADELIPGSKDDDVFSLVPYGEMPLLREGWAGGHMGESHVKFYRACREFVRDELMEDAKDGEETDAFPEPEVYQKMGNFGFLAARIGTACMPVVKELNLPLPGGISPDEFDPFHEMLAHEAIGHQLRQPGYCDGLGAGLCIGLPPVLIFAKPEIQQRVVPEVLKGNKRICLAISEPIAGSDVANIELTGKKSACGKFYVLNGVKKWITGGMFSDYFVTAVRTGGRGMKGISMMLVERSEGLTTRQISTSYSKAAGTALVMYDDVKVPVENLFGKENQGFKCIMANFNHERWFICAMALGSMRSLLKESYLWSMQREVFGHKLAEEPVIRQKLGKMTAAVEAVQANVENITLQMKEMDYFTQALKLAGPISFLKYNLTRTMTMLSDEACQIFGGRSITKTGLGDGVEKFQRTFKFASILGGSEEIMADLGVRQAMREFPAKARL